MARGSEYASRAAGARRIGISALLVAVASCGGHPAQDAGDDAAIARFESVTSAGHPVTVRQPRTLGAVDTELVDVNGTPIGIGCSTCHAAGSAPALSSRAGAPEVFHTGVRVAHGELTCESCHAPEDRTKLRLADGRSRDFAEVVSLCGQCHGPQRRDYEHGAHGGMSGYWDLTRGPRARNSCVACHAAHAPSIPRVQPAPPPRDRFLSPAAPRSGEAAHE